MSISNRNLSIVVILFSIFLAILLSLSFITGNLTANNFNLATHGVYLFYGYILAVIIIIPPVILYLHKKGALRSLYGLVFIIGVGFAIMIPISTQGEYIPEYNQQTLKEFKDISVLLDRISPVLIPVRNSILGGNIDTDLTIYKNDPNIAIKSVHLNSTGDTILSSNGVFGPPPSDKNNSDIVKYSLPIEIHHTGQISNITNQYEIFISYSYTNESKLRYESFSFDWPVKTMDLSVLTYLWIVMVGVITSRLISLMLVKMPDKGKSLAKGELTKITPGDSLWIIFSFIIAVLIFSTFKSQAQTQLTTSIIANISIAFGFGFGFDKVLEVAQRFQRLVS